MNRRHRLVLTGGVALAAILGTSSGAAAAGITTPAHHAYVVLVHDTSGTATYPDTQAQLLARIDAALSRWLIESDHLISSFTRTGSVQSFDADCSAGSPASAAWAAAGTLFPGVTFSGTSGNHLMVFGPEGCGGGVGTVGSDANGLSSGGKTYDDDSPTKGTQSLLHELGHNLSLEHAHAVQCDTSGTCTQADYGNDYAIMGATIVHDPAYLPAALDSFERTHLGVAKACEVPTLALADGQSSVTATYDVFGRGSSSAGTRGLAITDPATGVTTYLDWRDRAGRDAAAYYATSVALAQRLAYNAGVTVEKVVADGDSTVLQTHLADGKTPTSTSAATYLYAYTAGQTYTDGGTTVHVDTMPTANGTDAASQVTVTLSRTVSGSVPALPVQTGGVTISGYRASGAVLTAVPQSWTAGSCFRYQWLRDGDPVAGARSSTFTVPAGSEGHTFTVAVIGQQTGFAPRTSSSTGAVILTPQVTIAAPARLHEGDHLTVHGVATTGPVKLYRRLRGQQAFTLIATVTPTGDGSWSAPGAIRDDARFYAVTSQATSPTVLVQVAPTVTGPATRVVARNKPLTLSGTGIPGSVLTLHFHRAGTAASDYSVVRTATVTSAGTWSRTITPDVDHRYYATGVNGLGTPSYLVQVR